MRGDGRSRGQVEFDRYTEPMKRLLENFSGTDGYTHVVSSAHPRMVNGKPSQGIPGKHICKSRPGSWCRRAMAICGGSCRAPGARDPSRETRTLSGKRGTGRTQEQPPGPRERRAAARGTWPVSLPGIARAVHGIHFQPYRRKSPASSPDSRKAERGRFDR